MVRLIDAYANDCRTVLGGWGPDTQFCGAPSSPGRSYCEECCTRYFVKPEPPKRIKKKAASIRTFGLQGLPK